MTDRRFAPRALARSAACAATVVALAGLGACGSDGESSRSFCAALRSAPTLESVVSGFSSVDPGELTRRLDRASTAYATVRRTAPGDLEDEIDTVVDVVDAVIEAVRANDDDPRAAVAAVRAELREHPDLDGATTRVAAYAEDECDLDLNPGSDPTVTTTPITSPVDATTTTPGGD